MAGNAAPWLDAAARQLNAGDYAGAWASYLAAVQAEPGNGQAWLGLGLTALLQRQWDGLVQLADRRQSLAGDGFAFFHDVLTAAMGYGLGPLVEQMGPALAAGSPYVPSQLYYAGCGRLQADDEDAAFACFNRLKPLLAARRDHLPIGPGDRFNVAWRQASLVEDGDYPDTLSPAELAAMAARLPAMENLGQWGTAAQSDFVLLAACDGRYLERFGADFLYSLVGRGQGAALHLHVVEPEAGMQDRVSGWAARAGLPLTLTAEAANPWRGGAYYASARFLVAGQVRERNGFRPLMITDIDVAFTRPPADLAALAADAAFASFVHRDGIGPASRLPAVWTWFAGDGGGAMLDALRRTLLSKLDVPWPHNWMLDQAALITARRWLRRHRPTAGIVEIDRRCGQSFAAFLTCLGDEDEKAALIRAAARDRS